MDLRTSAEVSYSNMLQLEAGITRLTVYVGHNPKLSKQCYHITSAGTLVQRSGGDVGMRLVASKVAMVSLTRLALSCNEIYDYTKNNYNDSILYS